MTSSLDALVSTVLYEGYLLWPYRRSAQKNRKRWTFGGCYPRRFSETAGSNDPWWRRTECLVFGKAPRVTVTVTFLQVVRRQLYRCSGGTACEPVDALQVGTERYSSWEEAMERTLDIEPLDLMPSSWNKQVPLHIPAGTHEERVIGADGLEAGRLVRQWRELDGMIDIQAISLSEGLFKLCVRVANTTAWNGEDRDATLHLTFVSTHAVLSVQDGRFISLLEPPEAFQQAVEQCENVGTWPVLVGAAGAQDRLLSSPIILYDYPKVAPESPGDLFDGTEIDQLLSLNILSLTDEEKADMRSTDPRARAILARTESMTGQDFMRLHGTVRGLQELHSLEKPVPQQITVGTTAVRKGSRVRLRPKPGGDLWDMVLAGQTASVEAIEQDFEDRVHVAVSLDADPGRDLAGVSPGHRFFFSLDEVEVMSDEPMA